MAERASASALRRATDIVGAFIAALLVFTAVPAALVWVIGNPVSGGLGQAWSPLAHAALCALVLAAWVAWAACCAQLVRAVVRQVRRGDAPMRAATPMEWLAARIALGVFAITPLAAPLVLSAAAGATPSTVPPSVRTASSADAFARPPGESSPSALTELHVVRDGESLSAIALARLGDSAAWTDLAALNLGRRVSASEHMLDPDHVRAGWRLHLPRHAERSTGTPSPAGTGSGAAPDHLPELIVLGLGSLTCAALARRSRRRFRSAPFAESLDLSPAPSDHAVDTATLLKRFDGARGLQAFESANRLLGDCLLGHPGPGPSVRLIQVGPTGVTFHLASAMTNVPAPLRKLHDGLAWHVDLGLLSIDHEGAEPYVPIAFPVGDDDEGTWLLALGPADVVPLLGQAAADLRRAARAAVESWDWSDRIVATDDPNDSRLVDPVVTHCLFFGRSDALPTAIAARTSILTTEPETASDLTVLVDQQGASIHPLGRVVRPHLLTAATEEDIAELCVPVTDELPSQSTRAGNHPETGRGTPTLFASVATHPELAPGRVDVRVLTMTPRLDGLQEPLPPNRARRAVELVAYLAMHAPDAVTSDRLRTRVLGSTDADAASKTLFNVAHAARKALGVDLEGRALFPTGSRTGVYQLSSEVTVDLQRAIAFVAEAEKQPHRDASIAHYRAALDLVEGEPLANALSGYAWWETEGHGGRIAAVLVRAACAMATLAMEAGHFDLARWGLERARLVEPYSEALSRTAMEVAAAEGDADRLRSEWRDCQRRVDALDPGSSPSPRTEALFGSLSRTVLHGARRPLHQRVTQGHRE